MKAIPGKRYKHRKGGEYTVLCLAHAEANPEEILVIYRMEYATHDYKEGTIWARPQKNFEETLQIDGRNVDRFSQVTE